jgi:hypothetical protein
LLSSMMMMMMMIMTFHPHYPPYHDSSCIVEHVYGLNCEYH